MMNVRIVRRYLSVLGLVVLVWIAGGLVAIAQTVDELVAKNIEAKGGAAKIASVTTLTMSGTATAPGAPMPLPITITMKRPNMVRQEIRILDQRIVQAFDGERAWMINPMLGSDAPQELPAFQAEAMKDQADFAGPLIDYKAKGHTVEYIGLDTVQGKKAHKLKITRKSGQVLFVFLDVQSGLELKTTTEIAQPGGTAAVESLISDYRAEDGLVIPHTIQTLRDGQPVAQLTIDRVEIGAAIDDGVFRMPKGK